MNPDRKYQVVSARLRLNIVEWGPTNGRPLMLQHGGRDHCRSWDTVADAFAGEFRVIAPDLRGHGDSDWTNDGEYHPNDLVYDVRTIFDALELPPCCVVGHSLGGNIVTRFAGLFPERVIKLVNIEGLGMTSREAPDDDAGRHLDQLRAWIFLHDKTSSQQRRSFPDLASAIARMQEIDERLPDALARHLVVEGAHMQPDGSVVFKYDPGLMALAPTDLPLVARRALWREVACPVLAIYGAESWAKNPLEDGRLSHFRDARLVMFERAGHWVQHDRQTDFIATLRSFLAE